VPNFNVNTSIPNGGSINVLSGNQLEYLPWPAHIEFGAIGDSTGLTVTLFHGTELIAEEQPITKGTVDVAPKYPDDFIIFDDAAMGDRVKLLIKNPTAGAIKCFAVVRINKLI
jgi:hypothetical protein